MFLKHAPKKESKPRAKVVIIGGGFGGITLVNQLISHNYSILLIDQRPYHTFTPLLHQVATGELNPEQLAYPFRNLLQGRTIVQFRQGKVRQIDEASKVLWIEDERIQYDYLVLATGSRSHIPPNFQNHDHIFTLKSLQDALRIRNHIFECLEKAAYTKDTLERLAYLTFVVVGGGPTCGFRKL